jgi:hypothetical protein
VSDHHHYEYAEARHDHRGEYADGRHDHDLDYAEKHHRHYDDERTVGELQREVRELAAALAVYANDLSSALGRIRQLEAEHEADVLREQWELRDADEEPGSWRSTLADYAVASGAAEYDDGDDDEYPVACMRTVWVDNRLEQCGEPVDHEPTADCPGNPHARPAPEAAQP